MPSRTCSIMLTHIYDSDSRVTAARALMHATCATGGHTVRRSYTYTCMYMRVDVTHVRNCVNEALVRRSHSSSRPLSKLAHSSCMSNKHPERVSYICASISICITHGTAGQTIIPSYVRTYGPRARFTTTIAFARAVCLRHTVQFANPHAGLYAHDVSRTRMITYTVTPWGARTPSFKSRGSTPWRTRVRNTSPRP